MKCPHCDVDLALSERQGIEIDYCPKCRGVWLDRGELDKIIERAADELDGGRARRSGPQPVMAKRGKHHGDDYDDGYGSKHGYSGHGHKKHGYGKHGHGKYGRRRRSVLENIFDIFD